MKRLINITAKAATAILAVALTASCVFEKEDPAGKQDMQSVMVQLGINASGMAQTKAVIDAGEENATDAELLIHTIRFYAYIGETMVGYLDAENVTATTSLFMDLKLPASGTVDVDFYAVANEAGMYYDNDEVSMPDGIVGTNPDGTVKLAENIGKASFNEIKYSSLTDSQLTKGMPMYGSVTKRINVDAITGPNKQTGHQGHFILTDKVEMDLYRSLAKIGVYAAAVEGASVNPVIDSITFKAPGRRNLSYLFPAADQSELRARDNGISSMQEDRTFSTLTNNGSVGRRMAAFDIDKFNAEPSLYEILPPFYLAEVPYGTDTWDVPADASGRPAVLTIAYNLGKGTQTKYVDINMPEIKRNTFYKVFCLIKSEGQISIDIVVKDWTHGDEWVLEFDLPTATNPVPASSSFVDGAYQPHVQAPATMYYTFYTDENDNPIPTDAGAFSVDFRMTQPVGQSWTPTLNAASSRYFAINVYERNSGNKVTTPSIEASEDIVYTIKVYPLNPLSPMNPTQVAFSITYTPSWQGGSASYFLPINGTSATNLAWTEYGWTSGDYDANGDGVAPSTETIVITQIESPSAANN